MTLTTMTTSMMMLVGEIRLLNHSNDQHAVCHRHHHQSSCSKMSHLDDNEEGGSFGPPTQMTWRAACFAFPTPQQAESILHIAPKVNHHKVGDQCQCRRTIIVPWPVDDGRHGRRRAMSREMVESVSVVDGATSVRRRVTHLCLSTVTIFWI